MYNEKLATYKIVKFVENFVFARFSRNLFIQKLGSNSLVDIRRVPKTLHILGIVLYWSPMHCDLFKIYCAPPNLGINRT